MKKILIIIDTARVCGPSRQVLQLAEYCDQSQYDIHIGCTFLGGEFTEFMQKVKKNGLNLHQLQQKQSFDPSPILNAYRLIKDERFDIIQTHGYKAAVLGYASKCLTGIPWIAFMHGHTTESRKMCWYYSLEFHLVKRADRIVTVSEEMRSRLVSRGLSAAKTSAIRNSLDPDQFETRENKVSRNLFGIASEEKLIAVIGRFSPEKGQDVFLDAFRTVVEADDRVKAMLVGEGLIDEQLKKYCLEHGLSSKVIFAGYQQNIASFYPLFDLVVLPSRSEGLPNVAMEALHFGVPVVATSVGGTPEVIKDGITGLLVKPGDPNDLARGMSRMLSDHIFRNNCVSAGHHYLTEAFSPKRRVSKIQQLYSELSGRKSSKSIQ